MKRNKLATYAMGIAIAATMLGCGGDDGGDGGDDGGDSSGFAEESAEDIVAAAQKAMGDLESVHLSGDIDSDGSTIALDLSLSTTGSCAGDVTIDGGGLEVLQVDGEGWFKADDAFWQAQAPDQAEAIIAAAGGKWVVDTDGQFTSFCDLESFLEEVVSPDDENEFEKGDTTDVDGDEAIEITGDDSSAFIATDEPHYILKLEGTAEGEEGSMTFSDFDEEIEVEAPAEDDIVDLDQLG